MNGAFRRGLRAAGPLAAVALLVAPVVAGCTATAAPPPPDRLAPLLAAAQQDAKQAKADAAAFPADAPTLNVIAAVRDQHAAALRTEINRAAGSASAAPAPSSANPPAPASDPAAIKQLETQLKADWEQAAALVPTLPTYRAGLVGSIAAGCASLLEALGAAGNVPGWASAPPTLPTGKPPDDTVNALQQALAAEYATLWMAGTASAFVSGAAASDLTTATAEHNARRVALEKLLTADGVTPKQAEPAYTPPQPITSQSSALGALAVAESDETQAWRSVLEHTDDRDLRSAALTALIDSAVLETQWRHLAGTTPASVPMPGQPG